MTDTENEENNRKSPTCYLRHRNVFRLVVRLIYNTPIANVKITAAVRPTFAGTPASANASSTKSRLCMIIECSIVFNNSECLLSSSTEYHA